MKTVKIVLPKFLFFLFGGIVIAISLLSANRLRAQGESLELTDQRLYLAENIAPDHLLYPLTTAVDRLRLAMVGPERAVGLRVEYAWQRLQHTEKLLTKGYGELSFSTLTKSYKYYLTALAEAKQLDLTATEQQALLTNSKLYRLQAKDLFTGFSDQQQQELVRLDNQLITLEQF